MCFIILLTIQVNHSQRLSKKPLTPWIVSMTDGKIITAHCDCTAGLGETCSHVASLLWVLAVGIEKRESLTVTQKAAYWVMPPAVRLVPYLPIKDSEFIGKKRKACDVSGGAHDRSKSKGKDISPPTADEEKKFLDSLVSCSGAKPVVLSVLPTYLYRFYSIMSCAFSVE